MEPGSDAHYYNTGQILIATEQVQRMARSGLTFMSGVLTLILSMSVTGISSDVLTSLFRTGDVCDVDELQTKGCMSELSGKSSMLLCASTCLLSHDCEGFSFQRESKGCFLREHCPGVRTSSCPPDDSGLSHYIRHGDRDSCENGGFWDMSKQACSCIRSFVGYRCERRPESCRELFEYGYSGKRVPTHIAKRDIPSTPFFTYCSQQQGEPILYVAYYTGALRFDRNWAEYVIGFRDNQSGAEDFWIGLSNLRYLTFDQGLHDFTIRVTLSTTTDQSSFAILYQNFTVGNATSKYNYRYSNWVATKNGPLSSVSELKNCLTAGPDGRGFSTPDADNDADNHPDSCPGMTRSGWWFYLCERNLDWCNPFGRMLTFPNEPPPPSCIKLAGFDAAKLSANRVTVEMYLTDHSAV